MLQQNQAQIASNTRLWTGALEALPAKATTKTGVSAQAQSIYRFGQDTPGDASYWFTWNTHVHVAKGPIAGDVTERTYYSGDGYPKVTNNELALSGQPYPGAAYKLGVPAPSATPSATVDGPANVKTIATTAYSDGSVKTMTTNPDGSVSTVTTTSVGNSTTTTT
jgi:hypothetical protein